MTGFEAVVLGVVQGLTELLPISSTAHLRIVPAFVGWDDPGAAFTALIQLGTMAAVLLYFRADFLRIFVAWLRVPNIVHWLVAHGYSDDEIAKAAGGNTLRVWAACAS